MIADDASDLFQLLPIIWLILSSLHTSRPTHFIGSPRISRLVFVAVRDKPGPQPKIESDPNRPLIERALAMGAPMARIARRFGYSVQAIGLHRDRMPAQLRAAIIAAELNPKETDLDQLRIDESEGILGNLAHQRARLLLCQDESMEAGEFDLVARLSNTIHRNIELTGRYLGMFAQHHVATSVNITVSEDYLRLRHALIMALRPFPEARRAVAAELHRIEGEIAQGMLVASAGRPPPRQTLTTIEVDSVPVDGARGTL
jgi:hypothetical protein